MKVLAPAIKYDMLTEEKQKVLKELQKDQAATQKAETASRNRPLPYSGGPTRGVITKGECKVCVVMGHACKTAARDAAEQEDIPASRCSSLQFCVQLYKNALYPNSMVIG